MNIPFNQFQNKSNAKSAKWQLYFNKIAFRFSSLSKNIINTIFVLAYLIKTAILNCQILPPAYFTVEYF